MGKKGDQGNSGGAPAPAALHCGAHQCKSKPSKFNFCSEHYEQFKFGLIKKDGEKVSDYDRKFEHFLSYRDKRSAKKVA